MRKPSINQKNVASKIKKAIAEGRLINKGRIARECGYSDSSAKTMRPYINKSFQHEEVGILKMLERERDRVMKALAEKDISKEKYNTLIEAMDKLNKNTQLLAGESTENVVYTIIEG